MKKTMCSRCKSEKATVHYTKRVGDRVEEWELCPACAAKMGIGSAADLFGDPFGSFSLFSFPGAERPAKEQCPVCSLTLDEIRRKGKFGCSACYDTFASRLDMTPFVGTGYRREKTGAEEEKKIEAQAPKEDGLDSLRSQLQKAVAEENYELAAALRDQIREQEAK